MKRLIGITSVLMALTEGHALDTNVVYLPPQKYVFGEATQKAAHERQLASATNSPESRPAELDPEGNWGTVSAATLGLQLGVRFSTNIFVSGQPIPVRVILRNTGASSFVISTSGTRIIKFLVLNSRKEQLNPVPPEPFSGSATTFHLEPRRQVGYDFDLTQSFDVRTPGTYRVTAMRPADALGVPEVESKSVEVTVVQP